MNRRQFLAHTALASSAVFLSSVVPGFAATPRKLDAIGLQLYTVNDAASRDFGGTLRAVADMGYQQVEFSTVGGLYGRAPEDVKAQLKAVGLDAPFGRLRPHMSKDIDITSLSREEAIKLFFKLSGTDRLITNLEAMLPEAAAMGYQSIVLSAVSPQEMQDAAGLERLAGIFNQAGEICAERGMTFAYHNHDFDFVPVDGMLPFDYLLANTHAENVQFQLDLYWVSKAGQDPLRYLRDYGQRINSCHMKDMTAEGEFADVGSGILDFPAMTAAAVDAGIAYFFVEHDRPGDPLASAQASHDYLASMQF